MPGEAEHLAAARVDGDDAAEPSARAPRRPPPATRGEIVVRTVGAARATERAERPRAGAQDAAGLAGELLVEDPLEAR